MSLFSSIRMASNALRANDIAMQVVGQNIANANTDGYIREQVILVPSATQQVGSLLLGTGVNVDAIVQVVDYFLEDRLRGAISEQSYYETQENAYTQLESFIGELSDTDISTQLTEFFSAISEILNEPSDVSVRNLAVLQGEQLTETINSLANNVVQMRSDINDQIVDMASNINRLVEEIRTLNIRIAETEGGASSDSDAVGLRDQRQTALASLADLVSIKVEEQQNGAVVVYCGDTYLVYGGTSRTVDVRTTSINGQPSSAIYVSETNAPLDSSSGELAGLTTTRDKILGGFLDELDTFAGTLIYEFNKVYSSGQGLTGYEELTSEYAVLDSGKALNQAGLKFTPTTGSFQITVCDEATGVTKTTDVHVKLNGDANDTTLDSLIADLSDIDGLTVTKTATGYVQIKAAAGQEFYFSNDSSGTLASLGLNVFFSGTGATNISVSSYVADDPSLFAASQGGLGNDTDNATVLANFIDYPITSTSLRRTTLGTLYANMVAGVTQASAIAHSSAEGARVFAQTLESQQMAVSGVSLDEEAVNLMAYQRAFQAAAKYVATLSELLELLVNL